MHLLWLRVLDDKQTNHLDAINYHKEYRLKYSSELGWYYVKYGKKLTISKSQNMLKFQFYDVWKETIKMHQ